MIPAEWRPHRRRDGELIGYLAPADGDTYIPMTLLGTPIDDAQDEWSAADRLEETGLSYLAERWLLTDDDGTQTPVVVVEVSPDRVTVVPADFALVVGMSRDDRPEIALDVPTDRLQRP